MRKVVLALGMALCALAGGFILAVGILTILVMAGGLA